MIGRPPSTAKRKRDDALTVDINHISLGKTVRREHHGSGDAAQHQRQATADDDLAQIVQRYAPDTESGWLVVRRNDGSIVVDRIGRYGDDITVIDQATGAVTRHRDTGAEHPAALIAGVLGLDAHTVDAALQAAGWQRQTQGGRWSKRAGDPWILNEEEQATAGRHFDAAETSQAGVGIETGVLRTPHSGSPDSAGAPLDATAPANPVARAPQPMRSPQAPSSDGAHDRGRHDDTNRDERHQDSAFETVPEPTADQEAILVRPIGEVWPGLAQGWTALDRFAAETVEAINDDDSGHQLAAFFEHAGVRQPPLPPGLDVELYVGSQEFAGLHVLTFRGMEPLELQGDVHAGRRQTRRQQPHPHYDRGIELVRQLSHMLDGQLLLVGSSLGGGLASAASYATGLNAITFNAAGLSDVYRQGLGPGEIRAHVIGRDRLTRWQDNRGRMADALGTRIEHEGDRRGLFAGARSHGIENFLTLEVNAERSDPTNSDDGRDDLRQLIQDVFWRQLPEILKNSIFVTSLTRRADSPEDTTSLRNLAERVRLEAERVLADGAQPSPPHIRIWNRTVARFHIARVDLYYALDAAARSARAQDIDPTAREDLIRANRRLQAATRDLETLLSSDSWRLEHRRYRLQDLVYGGPPVQRPVTPAVLLPQASERNETYAQRFDRTIEQATEELRTFRENTDNRMLRWFLDTLSASLTRLESSDAVALLRENAGMLGDHTSLLTELTGPLTWYENDSVVFPLYLPNRRVDLFVKPEVAFGVSGQPNLGRLWQAAEHAVAAEGRQSYEDLMAFRAGFSIDPQFGLTIAVRFHLGQGAQPAPGPRPTAPTYDGPLADPAPPMTRDERNERGVIYGEVIDDTTMVGETFWRRVFELTLNTLIGK